MSQAQTTGPVSILGAVAEGPPYAPSKMAKIFGSEFHVDLSDVLRTVSTYPYNLIVGAAAAGTILFLIRR